jgi:hypothetical protein
MTLWSTVRAASTLVYGTGFEQSEGFSPAFDLAGQQGWVGAGTGGNGVFPDAFQTNQVAFIGYFAPESDSEAFTSVWKPLTVPAIPAGSIVKFSVAVTIAESFNRQYDDFRWEVYNTNGNRLLTVGFDNFNLRVFYLLNDGAKLPTQASFINSKQFTLIISMDFAHNRWGASIDGSDLGIDQPIAMNCLPLNLGRLDAAWYYTDPASPGDNYMLFDNYRVTLEGSNTVAQTVQVLCSESGRIQVRSFGQPGQRYALQASSTLLSNSWVSLFTNTAPVTGYFDFIDAYPQAQAAVFIGRGLCRDGRV